MHVLGGRQPVRFVWDRARTVAARVALASRPVRYALVAHEPVASNATVCLTSYPARLPLLHVTLRSLLHQSLRPAEIVLVLCGDEIVWRDLPRPVRALADSDIRILWVQDNTRSYKKLIPLLGQAPGSLIVTADDDVIYPRWWLKLLVAKHQSFPDDVICHRGLLMVPNPGAGFEPYASWPRAVTTSDPARVMPTGVSGILYPWGCLDPRVVDMELAMSVCPTADDIWFKVMALLQQRGARLTDGPRRDFPASSLKDVESALSSVNVGGGRNDEQLSAAWSLFADELLTPRIV